MDKFKALFRSRKFYAAVVSMLFIVVGERAGVSLEAITLAVTTLAAYILGTGLEDVRAPK